MSYPFKRLWLNGRFVAIGDVVDGHEPGRSAFEESALTFIREWLTDTQTFLQQTSGSTGTPKTISITRQQMEYSARLSEQALELQPLSNAFICIDTRYIGGKMMIVRSLVTKMAMWIVDPAAQPLQDLPIDQCVNFAAFVPYQIQSMLGSKHPHLINNIDTVIIGGAQLHDDFVEQLNRYQCRCYAAYGMTESISHVALRTLNGPNSAAFYNTLPGVEVNADDRECLVVKAPYLAEHLVTNDIVEIINNRQFRWLGRADNVINTGGRKVLPEKLEAAIQSVFNLTGIRNRFFVHGVEDRKLGRKVVIIVEAAGDHVELIRNTLLSLASEMPRHDRPKEMLISPAFQLTNTGKINRTQTLTTVTQTISLQK